MEHGSVDVKCPYYLGNNTKYQRQVCQIRCEGVSSGNCISLTFGSENVRLAYANTYCNSLNNCRNCLIHKMLNRKYGVDDV